MKIVIKIVVLLLLFIGTSKLSAQQDDQVIKQVHKAMKEANAKNLATFFHSTVDLEVDETDGNFSKNQAEMIIREFFSKNPVKTCTIKHQGSSNDGSKYIIGLYTSKSNTGYRVYILLKRSDAGLRINQMQFEED